MIFTSLAHGQHGRVHNRTSAAWAGGGGDSERLTFAGSSVPSLDHWNPNTGRWPSGLCLGTAWTAVLQVRCPGDTPISYSCQKTDIIGETPVSAPWPESGLKATGRRGPDKAAGRSQGRSHWSGRSPCGGSQALPRAGEVRNRAWEAVLLQSLDRRGGAPVGCW